MRLTGGFIVDIKNSFRVSRDTCGQIQIGISSATILWQIWDFDLQTFYTTHCITQTHTRLHILYYVFAAWQQHQQDLLQHNQYVLDDNY